MFLNNSQNWQKNNCARVSFLIKLQAGRLPLECYLSISFIITSTGKHWSYNHSSLYRYHLNHMKSHEINVLSFPSFSIFLWNSLKIRCSFHPGVLCPQNLKSLWMSANFLLIFASNWFANHFYFFKLIYLYEINFRERIFLWFEICCHGGRKCKTKHSFDVLGVIWMPIFPNIFNATHSRIGQEYFPLFKYCLPNASLNNFRYYSWAKKYYDKYRL